MPGFVKICCNKHDKNKHKQGNCLISVYLPLSYHKTAQTLHTVNKTLLKSSSSVLLGTQLHSAAKSTGVYPEFHVPGCRGVRNIFQRGQSHFSLFFPVLKCFSLIENSHFGSPKTNFSGFEK